MKRDATNFTNQFICSVRKYALKNGINKVSVAVSGGADSIAALALSKDLGLDIKALHCNFHLRREESNRDERHVKKICETLEIPLEIIHFDVKKYMEENPGTSLEMACRELRHEWFRKVFERETLDRLITGHNADDNIETFFINLLRGSGTSGLKGMVADNGYIWRPLLTIHRVRIIEYLKVKGLDYVIDSTNLESDYRRNFLRNDIIPLLKSRWEGFDKAMDSTIRHLQNENLIIEASIQEALPEDDGPLHSSIISAFPDPELLVRRYISSLHPFNTTASEIVAAIKARKPHIRKWKLRKGEVILRNGYLSLKLTDPEI